MTTDHAPAASSTDSTFTADLPDIGLLGFDGPEAATFMQGQLSSDVLALRPGDAQWSSYNSPKGRMLGTLLLWREGEESFRAAASADITAALAKRLSMFVLRAKLRVSDLSATGARLGVGGEQAAAAVAAALGAAPLPGHAATAGGASIVALPDGRLLICAPEAVVEPVRAALRARAADLPASRWHALGIAAGVARVMLATQDAFIPQSANWDLIGGVNFKKGCYPGQEIVARMQYLGRLKERLQRFTVAAPPPAPGTSLYGEVFGAQACGTVVEAVARPEGGSDLLAVVQWAALEGAALEGKALTLGAPAGPALTPAPLPYTVPTPVAASRPRLS